jgi:hypothetical protein
VLVDGLPGCLPLVWRCSTGLRTVISGSLLDLRLEAGFQSFGCLRDRAATAALERLLRLDPATHPRAVQADSGVTRRFKRGTDARSLSKEIVGRVGGGLDALGRLPLPAPTCVPWEWGKGCWTVSLSLRGGSGPDDPSARKLADALDIIRQYNPLWTVIYTDGLAVGGVKRGGSSAVVTSGDPSNPNFLDVRHQYGPEYTTLRLRCGSYGWHLNALTMRLLLLVS